MYAVHVNPSQISKYFFMNPQVRENHQYFFPTIFEDLLHMYVHTCMALCTFCSENGRIKQ